MTNLGNITNAFQELLVESYISKNSDTKDKYNTFIKTIKESDLLKTEYSIYENIISKQSNTINQSYDDMFINEYIRQNISLMDPYTVDQIKEQHESLRSLLTEDSYMDVEFKNKELCENIHNLIILNKNKTPQNLDKIVESFNYIFNYIKNNKLTESTNKVIDDDTLSLAISKFNKKYQNISENEKVLVKTLIQDKPEGKETILKNSIIECIDLIDSNLNESNDLESKEKLLKVKDKLLRISYNENTFIDDVSKIINLTKDLK